MWIYSILDREIPVNSYIISEYTWHIDIFYLHYYIILHYSIYMYTPASFLRRRYGGKGPWVYQKDLQF